MKSTGTGRIPRSAACSTLSSVHLPRCTPAKLAGVSVHHVGRGADLGDQLLDVEGSVRILACSSFLIARGGELRSS